MPINRGGDQATCPECKSVDVSNISRPPSQRGHARPPWYCYDCGIRFSSPYWTLEEDVVDGFAER